TFFKKSLVFINCVIVLFACKKEDSKAPDTKGNVGFDNRDVTSLPIKIYVDGILFSTIGNPMPVSQYCGNLTAQVVLPFDAGNHSFALVDAYGYYADGNFSVAINGCTHIPIYYSNFDKVNYGTDNGSLTIVSSILNANQISVSIDNSFIANISHAAGYFICGYNEDQYVVSQRLTPGTHTYKAVENGTGKSWSGSKVIQANTCTSISLRP
ncbi:MAG: hypothetical protein ABIN67_24075, partial [Ferruginibacter sp.]